MSRVYPRVCGGTCRRWPAIRAQVGLSPRVRGNPGEIVEQDAAGGSIPACAGEPPSWLPRASSGTVYPRVCGGTPLLLVLGSHRVGLSPRVRGNRGLIVGEIDGDGSIPACAGEPSRQAAPPPFRRVYPRVCGGTAPRASSRSPRKGLSPRVRGNRDGVAVVEAGGGSIPACAGEPPVFDLALFEVGVYPRVCGGTGATAGVGGAQKGLSPRVRGNRSCSPAPASVGGSIPACAGEPKPTSKRKCSARVYPRVCGGTANAAPASITRKGLSPRVRGNPRGALEGVANWGSIPACAGEPCCVVRGRWRCRVYPRVCGGTLDQAKDAHFASGLSPRVRGNLLLGQVAHTLAGSIPACAGEPRVRASPSCAKRVYPRVCGGTAERLGQPAQGAGLSPRVRGNQVEAVDERSGLGSIPACAGEPPVVVHVQGLDRVYPRVCGGTVCPSTATLICEGLSPRVRGNPSDRFVRDDVDGSIPACAGEPVGQDSRPPPAWVYPRVCGGTEGGKTMDSYSWGLSPRVRGNQHGARSADPKPGSIPACAGEPRQFEIGALAARVYPRVCGGTRCWHWRSGLV